MSATKHHHHHKIERGMRPQPHQGKTPQQMEASARLVVIGITALIILAFFLFLTATATAATGYLITAKDLTQNSKTEVYKVSTAARADSILALYAAGFKVGTKIMGYTQTPTHLLYFEKKEVVTRRNGTLKFRKLKTGRK